MNQGRSPTPAATVHIYACNFYSYYINFPNHENSITGLIAVVEGVNLATIFVVTGLITVVMSSFLKFHAGRI